jgi:hypothetical protein
MPLGVVKDELSEQEKNSAEEESERVAHNE